MIFISLVFFFGFYFQLGKDYFDLQPSWFDTLSNKFGCLKVDNSPVTARDLEAMKNVKSNLKLSTEAAKGKRNETCYAIAHIQQSTAKAMYANTWQNSWTLGIDIAFSMRCLIFIYLFSSNQAKITLTLNRHGLTLYQKMVDVFKLKTLQ